MIVNKNFVCLYSYRNVIVEKIGSGKVGWLGKIRQKRNNTYYIYTEVSYLKKKMFTVFILYLIVFSIQ